MTAMIERAVLAESQTRHLSSAAEKVRRIVAAALDLSEEEMELAARAVCEIGGGDPDRLCEGYVRTRGEKQHDRTRFDPQKGRLVHDHAFWREFQSDASAVLAALKTMGEREP